MFREIKGIFEGFLTGLLLYTVKLRQTVPHPNACCCFFKSYSGKVERVVSREGRKMQNREMKNLNIMTFPCGMLGFYL